MRCIICLFACFSALFAVPAAAAGGSAARFVSPQLVAAEQEAIAVYGPFRVLDGEAAALVDITDENSPAQFNAMITAHPGLRVMRIIEAPGTYDDRANLRLGRMIRAAGMAVHVPDGGSVRSGAVELVLSGVEVQIDDGAEFAVHAWLDDTGLEASDYRAGSPEHLRYLAYYQEMGMGAQQAAAFYAMTNSVPYDDALWLTGREMRRWIGSQKVASPRLAYLDLNLSLN